MGTQSSEPRWTRRRQLFLAALAVLVVLGGMEALARLAGSVIEDRRSLGSPAGIERDAAMPSPELGWMNQPGFDGRVHGADRRFDERGFLASDGPDLEASGGSRVVFIGDSNTFGFGVSADSTFAEAVARELPGVRAINLGVNGYSSYQGVKVLERALDELRPDGIVFSFNFNDRRYVPPGDPADGPERMELVHARLTDRVAPWARAMEWSHTYRLLRSVLRRVGLLEEPVDRARLDELQARVGPSDYRANLERAAALAEAAGVPIVFLVLQDSPVHAHALDEGRRLIESGERDEGLVWLEMAVRAGDFRELARREMASAMASGPEASATDQFLDVFGVSRDHDGGFHIHSDDEYAEIMVEVAGTTSASLVDVRDVLTAHPGDFIDQCHFTPAAHARVGSRLAATLGDLLQGSPG